MTAALSQGFDSESNSPKLGSAPAFHYESTSEEGEEDHRQELENGERDSQDSWNERQDNGEEMLPEAAIGPDGTPDPSIVSGNVDEMLPRDVQRKTAYYDYADDKQLSQADAKLFYQRSQLDGQKTGESNWGHSQTSPNGSPVMMPRSFSNMFEQETRMQRSGSVNSMKSGKNTVQGSVAKCSRAIGNLS
jgi:AMP deaminase